MRASIAAMKSPPSFIHIAVDDGMAMASGCAALSNAEIPGGSGFFSGTDDGDTGSVKASTGRCDTATFSAGGIASFRVVSTGTPSFSAGGAAIFARSAGISTRSAAISAASDRISTRSAAISAASGRISTRSGSTGEPPFLGGQASGLSTARGLSSPPPH